MKKLTLLMVLLILYWSSITAQELVKSYQERNGIGTSNFGSVVTDIGDFNGDGFDDIAIGAPNYDGSKGRVYIFYGGSNSDNTPDLIFEGEATNINFGISISGAGDFNGDGYDDLIVGCNFINNYKGRAYIYFGGSNPNTDANVVISGSVINKQLGKVVSGIGDFNNDGYDDVAVAEGYNYDKVYIYLGGPVTNNEKDLTITGTLDTDFGYSLSGAGDFNNDGYDDIIIGQRKYDSDRGRAYIYYGGSTLNSAPDIVVEGDAPAIQFGNAVAGGGDFNNDGIDDVIIGANYYNSSKGRVYVLYGANSPNAGVDLILNGDISQTYFGQSVSFAGDVNNDGTDDIIIGANTLPIANSYIFYGASNPSTSYGLKFIAKSSNDRFGNAVSAAGDIDNDGYADVIVGAHSVGGAIGGAYLYKGGSTPDNVSDIDYIGETKDNNLGRKVSVIGDINGDGIDDFAAGAIGHNNNRGAVYVYLGSDNPEKEFIIIGQSNNDKFGYDVSGIGDINNDGYDDFIVGANTNKAYIYLGSASPDNVADRVLTGENSNDGFGKSCSGVGDVNNDGYDDFVIGACFFNNGGNINSGKVYLYYGGSNINSMVVNTFMGEAASNYFGLGVSGVGDVNNDGYDDFAVGAYGYNSTLGRVYLYYGKSSHITGSADVIFTGTVSGQLFGYSVSGAGDVNGDNYDDIMIGSYGSNTYSGKVSIYYGGAVVDNVVDVSLYGQSEIEYFGQYMTTLGDINSDGYDDIVVSSYAFNERTGKVSLFLGAENMSSSHYSVLTGSAEETRFGEGIAGGGDVTGDGVNNFLLGAPDMNNKNGELFLYTFYFQPEVQTIPVRDVLAVSATLEGNVNALGSKPVTAHGFCWDTDTEPTTSDSKVDKGTLTETGIFSASATGLLPNTKYYVRAFVKNSTDTYYGNEFSFTTAKANQTITFNALAAKSYGDANFDLTATASSNLAVSYLSSDTDVATVSGSTVTIVGAGTTRITASQTGNSNYEAAPTVDQDLVVNKANQTITFNALAAKSYGDSNFDLTATAGSNLTVSYQSSDTDVATVSGSTVTIVGAGTTRITASQVGNDNYNAASTVDQDLVVNKANQTITFNVLAAKSYGDANFDLTATVGSNLTVSYQSSDTDVATVSGSTVTIVGAGTTTITASQIGDDNYNAASTVDRDLVINKANQTITFDALSAKSYGDASFDLTATASSNLVVSYQSSDTDVATVSGSTVTIVGVGITTITASQIGDDNYNAASIADRDLVINKANQTITFDALSAKSYGDANFDLTATAGSNLVVSYQSSDTDVATVSGSTVTIVGVGTTTITASQIGDDNYNAASTVDQDLVVNKANQTITFDALAAKSYGDTNFDLTATAGSNLVVSYQSSDTDVATVSGNTVTIVGAGTTTITASQTGNGNYEAAPTVDQELVVNKANQTITFDAINLKAITDKTFTLDAVSSSGLPIVYSSSNTDVATVAGNTVTIVGVGKTIITAKQIGNGNYGEAAEVQQELVVTKDTQKITFAELASVTYGDVSFNLDATSTSGLPVTFTSSNTNVVTITGNSVTIVGAGETVITAIQSGDDEYEPTSTEQRLTVNKANQVITFDVLSDKQTGDIPFDLSATTSSGLDIMYISSDEKVATISGNTVTITGHGITTITASQSGNANYNAAESVQQTLTVLLSSDINDAEGAGIKVYPNPVSDMLNIESEKYIDIVQILNVESRLLRTVQVNGFNKSIDVSNLGKGVYFIKIKSENNYYVIRVIKR